MGPNLIALAIPLFFAGIGVEALVGHFKGRRIHRLGDAMSNMGCGILQQLVSTLLAAWVIAGTYEWVYQFRFVTIETPWVGWVVGTFAVEFAYYWWHRLSHTVNFLWAAHSVHHHSEDYNLSVALRQSIATWATGLPFYLPVALLGVTTFQFSVILSLSTLYQFWIHTELVPSLGVLEWVLNTPALHRVHHAINGRYLDKNHAATFSFYDVVFGTFEREREPCVYGTTRPLQSFNAVTAQFDYGIELWHAFRAAPTARDSLKVFLAGPSWKPAWWPKDARVRSGVERFDVPAGPGLRRYLFWNWALMLVGVFLFLLLGASLSALSTAAVTGWIVLAVLALPGLYEGKKWARTAEIVRLASVLPVVAMVVWIR